VPEVGSPPTPAHGYDDEFYFSVHFQPRVDKNIIHNITDVYRQIAKSHAESRIPLRPYHIPFLTVKHIMEDKIYNYSFINYRVLNSYCPVHMQ